MSIMVQYRAVLIVTMATMAFGKLTINSRCSGKDDKDCSDAITKETRANCDQHFIELACCNTCVGLIDQSLPEDCPFGDITSGVHTGRKLYSCEDIKNGNCAYCVSPKHGKENCCETCYKYCTEDGKPKQTNKIEKIDTLLRILKDTIEGEK